MEIQGYNAQQLNEFIDSDFFRNLNNIPISYHRAISQIKNPYRSDDDMLLWAAYEAEKLVGYVGVLPDILENNGSKNKVFWLSCFWVDPEYRNENLASQLFYLLVKQYKNQLFITNFILTLEITYQSLGIFQATQYTQEKTFFLNFCFTNFIQNRYPYISPILPFFHFGEKLLNQVLKIRKKNNKIDKLNFKIHENNELDEELENFLKIQAADNDSNVRSIEYFNWVLTYPWIIEGSSDKESNRYFFSSKAIQFKYRILKIYNHNSLEGMVLLKVRDRNLSISHLYTNDGSISFLAEYLISLSLSENLNTITTSDRLLNNALMNNRNSFIYIKESKRPYILPKSTNINVSFFQSGDGDLIFT